MTDFLVSFLTLFCLRLVDISLYTVRIMMVVRGKKAMAWTFGFFQAFVYVLALQAILSDVGNWGKIMGYAAGFATGVILGMYIEGKLAIGYTHIRVTSPCRGAELTGILREAGFGITEIAGHGKDGAVAILNCSVQRRKAAQVERLVQECDPDAFITAEDVRSVKRGFWGG